MSGDIKMKMIPCPDHSTSLDEPCGICLGTFVMRLETLVFEGVSFEIYVPSSLTQLEAQLEYDRSLDLLMNNFNLSN